MMTKSNARLDLAAELATGTGPGAAGSAPGFEDEVGWRFDRIDEDLAEVEAYAAGYAKLPELAQAAKLATVAGFKLRRLVDGADPATVNAPVTVYQDGSPGVWAVRPGSWSISYNGEARDTFREALQSLIGRAIVWVSFEDGRSGEYEVIAVGAGLTLRGFTATGTKGPDDDTEYALEDITEVLVY